MYGLSQIAAPIPMPLQLCGLLLVIGLLLLLGRRIISLLSTPFSDRSFSIPSTPKTPRASTSRATPSVNGDVASKAPRKPTPFQRAPASGGVRTTGKPTEPQVDWVTGRRLS